ncbi:MAG: TolC family protein [Desulfobacteraceae bacterium]|nr:TolC family protein [Desulfobacteraceae bacterium]
MWLECYFYSPKSKTSIARGVTNQFEFEDKKIRINIRLACMLLIMSVFSIGCSNQFKMDLTKQRHDNLAEDLKAIQAQETMKFPDPLTLDEVIRVGLENNLEMRISRIMAEIEKDSALAEKLGMLPDLSFSGNASYRSNYAVSEYEDIYTGKKVLGSTTNSEKATRIMDIRLSWNILDFGLSYLRSRQAAVGLEIKRMERIRQSQKLALDLSNAYWKSVLTQKDLERVRAIESEATEYKKKADELVAQKRIDPIVARGIEKQLSDLSITANGLQSEMASIRIELGKLMGISPFTRFDLANESTAEGFVENMPEPSGLDPRRLEIVSLNNRPELFSADLEEKVRQDDARSVLLSMFPSIRLDAAQNYDYNSFLANNTWSSVGISVAQNFLDIPSKYMSWKAKDKTVSMVKAQRLMLTAGVIAQVHIALQDYRAKEKQFRLYNNAWLIAEDLLNMSRERNKLGTVTDLQVTQRMMETVVAKLQRDRSLTDVLNAYNMLLVTLGLDYGRWRENLMEFDEHAVPADIQTKDIVKPSESKKD